MLPYTENKKLTVINMFSGPGAGKSTTAAALFYLMKAQYYNVELVTEQAKDLVWNDRLNMLTEQDYIFAKQNNRLRRLVGKVEYAVTDSPILLGNFYLPDDFPPHFSSYKLKRSYKKIDYLITSLTPTISPPGRFCNWFRFLLHPTGLHIIVVNSEVSINT